jgi:uncharacterized protein (DUF362 family)
MEEAHSSAVKKCVDTLGGIENIIEKDARILIKPNLLFGMRYDMGTTTNPIVLKTLVELIQPVTRSIALIESNFGIAHVPGGPIPLFREVGDVFELEDYAGLRKLGVRFIDLGKEKQRWLSLTPNNIMDKVRIPVDLFEDATLVNVPVLKNHGITKVTLGLKNLFGLIPSPPVRYRLHDSISPVLSDLAELFRSIFTVIDGSIGMEGPCACFGAPAESNLVIGSEDIVSADSVAARLMGYDPRTVDHIVEAEKRGLGQIDRIKFQGENVGEIARRFSVDSQLPLAIVRRAIELGKAREEDLLSLYPSDTGLVKRYIKSFQMWGLLVAEGESYRFERKFLDNFICRRCTQTTGTFCKGWKRI